MGREQKGTNGTGERKKGKIREGGRKERVKKETGKEGSKVERR